MKTCRGRLLRVLVIATVSMLSTSVATAPIPPVLTLDLPPSEINGVWRLTRFATLFGPTPAILLYRQACKLYEAYEPGVRARVFAIAAHLHRTVSAPIIKVLQNVTADDMADLNLMMDTSIWPTLGLQHEGKGDIQRSTDPEIDSTYLQSIVSRIFADPRLKGQRIRETRFVLGDTGPVNLKSLYSDYRSRLEQTMRVMQEHVDLAMLDPVEEAEVQRAVAEGMDGWWL
jgi:hypothetical protein